MTLAQKLKIAAAVTILSTILIGIAISQPRDKIQWKPATQLIRQSKLKTIVQDNSNAEIDLRAIKAAYLNGIILIDFNTPKLCGKAGCLYVAYDNRDRILNLILQPHLDLFTKSTTDTTRTCIDIKQTLINTYCYDGKQFIRTLRSSATEPESNN